MVYLGGARIITGGLPGGYVTGGPAIGGVSQPTGAAPIHTVGQTVTYSRGNQPDITGVVTTVSGDNLTVALKDGETLTLNARAAKHVLLPADTASASLSTASAKLSASSQMSTVTRSMAVPTMAASSQISAVSRSMPPPAVKSRDLFSPKSVRGSGKAILEFFDTGPDYARNHAYIIHGTWYEKYDLMNDESKGWRKVKDGFPNLPFKTIDACLVAPECSRYHGVAWLFCGDRYCRWNMYDDSLNAQTVEQGAWRIKDGFRGFPFPKVDAVLVYPSGVGCPGYSSNMAYMFCGNQYCKWDLKNDKMAAGPRAIDSGFPGLRQVDCFLQYPKNSGYDPTHLLCFTGENGYQKWDMAKEELIWKNGGVQQVKVNFPNMQAFESWNKYDFS